MGTGETTKAQEAVHLTVLWRLSGRLRLSEEAVAQEARPPRRPSEANARCTLLHIGAGEAGHRKPEDRQRTTASAAEPWMRECTTSVSCAVRVQGLRSFCSARAVRGPRSRSHWQHLGGSSCHPSRRRTCRGFVRPSRRQFKTTARARSLRRPQLMSRGGSRSSRSPRRFLFFRRSTTSCRRPISRGRRSRRGFGCSPKRPISWARMRVGSGWASACCVSRVGAKAKARCARC